MSDLTHHHIPGLGQVALRAISIGDVSEAEEQADLAEAADRASTFTNYIMSSVIIEPPYTSEDVASLSDDAVIDLIRAAIDIPELRDNFNNLPTHTPPRERFHQAYVAFLRSMIEKIDFTPLFTELSNSVQRIIDGTLTHISDNFNESQHIIEQALSAINKQFDSQRQEIQRIFNSFGDIFRRSLEDARMASQAAGNPLTQAGFWMPPSAPIYLLTAIKRLVDEGESTPENVRQFIIDCFDQRDFYHLKHMVESWRSKPFFADRMQVIEDALEAHINGKYTLSIPVLLPLVEGILTDIVGRRANRADGGIGNWAGNAIQNMYSDFLKESSKDAIVSYITGMSVYGYIDPAYFTPKDFPSWLMMNGLSSQQFLHRHAILHGVQKDYASKANSLRAFFMLDVLAQI